MFHDQELRFDCNHFSKHRKSRAISTTSTTSSAAPSVEFSRSVSVPADRIKNNTPLNNIIVNTPTTPDLE